ncbi:MAG TPA: RecX family transcriptional regulator [Candidatus Saccharimonadales bacterium]|nr:RecX family transcriptional regulator [Candidatus Saccharimonadales bacterium]
MRITNIQPQLKRPDRYSVFVDGKYAFSLSESGLLAQGIVVGQELDASSLIGLKEASSADKAYGNALRYTAMRPRSEWEVGAYLRRKAVDKPTAEHIIQRLKGAGLLNDAGFARAWISNRRLLKSTSKRRLRLELKQKQVPEAIIDQALREDEVTELDVLRELIKKKRERYPDRNKFIQYLARQGFGYDDIKAVLNEAEEA